MDRETHVPWNNKIVMLLNKIGRKTMGYRWMHDQASQHNQSKHLQFKIVEVILAAMLDLLTGGELCGFIFNEGLNTNKTLIITITCIQFALLLVSHIITGIKITAEFDKVISQHDYAAKKFGEINLSIQQKLALEVEVRGDDKEFLNHMVKAFSDLLEIAPKIEQKIQDEYVEKASDNDVFAPISADVETGHSAFPTENVGSEHSHEERIPIEKTSNYQIERWLRNF
jgi:hypothetical protein